MANRAVITTSSVPNTGTGIYIHWNGGPESVLAFLQTCKDRKYRDPAGDAPYAMARLCGVICEFFGVDSSAGMGIGPTVELDTDNGDNGTYVIGKDWRIVNRYGEGSTNKTAESQFDASEAEKYHAIVAELRNSYARNTERTAQHA